MNTPRWQRDQERLDEMQRRIQERLDQQQERIAQHLERVQERINKRYGKAPMSGDMQARIIRAGLELLREDGLEKLSLRKLAQRVNVQAPALYWYFKDKAILVDYLAEGILQSEFGSRFAPRQKGQSWQDWLIDTMLRLREAMLAFPDGGRVVAGAHLYPAETLTQIIEYSLESLITDGVSESDARTIHMTTLHYTFGHVIEEQAAPEVSDMATFDFNHLLDNYPYLHKMVKMIDLSEESAEAQYKKGLLMIINGASFRS